MNVVLIRNTDKLITEQEVEIVKLLREGLLATQISTQMKINKRTLEAKILRLKASYKAKTVAQLVGDFKDLGLI